MKGDKINDRQIEMLPFFSILTKLSVRIYIRSKEFFLSISFFPKDHYFFRKVEYVCQNTVAL